MNYRMLGLGLVFGLVLGMAAPSLRAADKETRQMMADIRMLQEQTQQLQNLIGQLSKALGEALDATAKSVNAGVDAKLEEQTNNTRKSFADQKLGIDAITRDVTTLREKVDENNVRVGQLTQEVTALRQLVTQLNAARATYDPALGPADAPSVALPSSAPTAGGAAALGMSPTAAWDQAFSDYSSGQYDFAIQGFDAYIKSFPSSPQAAEAQLYICSSYLNMPNYAKAVDACDLVIRNYPASNRLPEAYYRKGLALRSVNRTDEARAAFEYVTKTYPNSDAAILANTQLMSQPAARKP